MVFHFFTLPLEYRTAVFRQIHEIVFFGKGGYDWDTVYNMPIWLRRFTFNTMNEYYEKENEEYNKAVNKGKTITERTPIAKPNIAKPSDAKPTYKSPVIRK